MFKKFLAASLIVGNLFCLSVADAEIKTYTATADDSANKLEAQEVVKLRALDKAIKIAAKQAEVDFKNNFGKELTDEEISAIIFNSCELGEVKYTQAKSAWQTAVEIKIDDAEVKNWIQRSDREKFMLLNQSREAKKFYEINNDKLEKLRKRAENMPKKDKKFFKDEFEFLANEFLSNRKVVAGNKFVWRGRFDDAITLYTEATELNQYNAAALNRRGNLYNIIAEGQKIFQSPKASVGRRLTILIRRFVSIKIIPRRSAIAGWHITTQKIIRRR